MNIPFTSSKRAIEDCRAPSDERPSGFQILLAFEWTKNDENWYRFNAVWQGKSDLPNGLQKLTCERFGASIMLGSQQSHNLLDLLKEVAGCNMIHSQQRLIATHCRVSRGHELLGLILDGSSSFTAIFISENLRQNREPEVCCNEVVRDEPNTCVARHLSIEENVS